MWKFLLMLSLLAASFGAGFYFGQRPAGTLQSTVGEVRQSIKDASRQAIDTTMGIEQDLRRRQALLDTKAKVVQSKSELFDKNFGEAAKQLAEAVAALEGANKGAPPNEATQAIRKLILTLQDMRMDLSMGKPVPMKKLNEFQEEIDRQLNK